MPTREPLPKPHPKKDPLAPWSNAFFITINTNNTSPRFKAPLYAIWKYIVSHIVEFMYGRPGSRLINVKQYAAVETGKKTHRVHLHGTLVARTTGIAFLDYYKLNKYINEVLKQVEGFKRCNFNARLIKNYNQNEIIRAYIDKNQDEEQDSDFD